VIASTEKKRHRENILRAVHTIGEQICGMKNAVVNAIYMKVSRMIMWVKESMNLAYNEFMAGPD